MDNRPARPWIIAHRGASAVRRENTLAAFREAARRGADAVEFDIRRTADGALVVHHDATVTDVGVIIEMTAAELRERSPWVPTLAETVESCAGMWMNIEIKNSPLDPDFDPDDTVVEAVLAHIGRSGDAARVLISSFNPQTAARAVGRLPGLQTALLTDLAVDPAASVAMAADAGHAALNPHVRTLEGSRAEAVVERARTVGIGVVPWTVDDPTEIRRLAAAGVTGIITNVPDVARSELETDR